MSKVDLDAIEARAKAATPGPWKQGGHYDGEWFDFGKNSGYVRLSDGHEISVAQKAGKYDDAEFIAHARQDVEDMAREIRKLRAILDSEADSE